jgi:hypothetical protein
VPEQQHFTPFIPTVYGNIDYRRWQSQLVRIDEILRIGLIEESFQGLALAQRNTQEKAAAEKETRAVQNLSQPPRDKGEKMPDGVKRPSARQLGIFASSEGPPGFVGFR